jgi:hypothetical protein
MRKYLISALTLFVCSGTAVEAGIPDAARSGCALEGQSLPCQFVFRHDGSLDTLTLCVTLRDVFDVGVPVCSTSATLNSTGLTFCSCCPNPQVGATDSTGVVYFVWEKLGGRGSAEVCVTAHCVGDIAICCQSFNFTSTDLAGDCTVTDVVDLGPWAGCLHPSPYCQESDYNCDGTVDVIDLGLFAGGLTVDCSDGPACP